MESWAIFKHAVRMVFQNLGDAVRVTGVLYIALILPSVIILLTAGSLGIGMKIVAFFIVIILAIYFLSWIGVCWHRFVLLVEKPSIVPTFYKREIAIYSRKTIQLGLVYVLAATLLILLIVLAEKAFGLPRFFYIVASYLVGVPLFYVGFRASLVFPSAALGMQIQIRDSWSKLANESRVLWGLAAISTVVAAPFGNT